VDFESLKAFGATKRVQLKCGGVTTSKFNHVYIDIHQFAGCCSCQNTLESSFNLARGGNYNQLFKMSVAGVIVRLFG
jgi:hypothetical protein